MKQKQIEWKGKKKNPQVDLEISTFFSQSLIEQVDRDLIWIYYRLV